MAKKKAQEEVKTEEVVETEKITVGDLFARKPERGVVVMTEAASMASEATRMVGLAKRDQTSYIHKIKKDKK